MSGGKRAREGMKGMGWDGYKLGAGQGRVEHTRRDMTRMTIAVVG